LNNFDTLHSFNPLASINAHFSRLKDQTNPPFLLAMNGKNWVDPWNMILKDHQALLVY